MQPNLLAHETQNLTLDYAYELPKDVGGRMLAGGPQIAPPADMRAVMDWWSRNGRDVAKRLDMSAKSVAPDVGPSVAEQALDAIEYYTSAEQVAERNEWQTGDFCDYALDQ